MKKLLISLFIGLTIFLSFAPYLSPIKAQTTWYNQGPSEWYLKVYDNTNPNEIFGERYTAAQVQWIIYTIPSIFINWLTNGNTDLGGCLMGIVGLTLDPVLCDKGITTSINDLKIMLGIAENVPQVPSIASQIFADRPISGIGYVRNLIKKLSPVTTVHAQTTGFGFDILIAIRPLWVAVRNISFSLFVIVAIVFAFMIMFRVKLSPQVVISVQSALPKIIIALVLVTFSYAIAGLMIDLLYVLMGVFSTLMATSLADVPYLSNFAARSIFAFINGTMPIIKDSGINIILYFIIYLVGYLVATIMAFIAAASGIHFTSMVFTLVLLIFWIVLVFILIWYVLKTIFVLFKTLAAVYGLIIIAPLQITAGVLFPQMGFGSWLKKLFSKLIVFPLTGVLIFISYILLYESWLTSWYGIIVNNVTFGLVGGPQIWITALANLLQLAGFPADVTAFVDDGGKLLAGNWGPPMLGNPAAATPIAFLLMSVGAIMMIPKISEAIDGFMAGKGFAGTGIGEALGPFGTLGKAVGGEAMGVGTRIVAGRLKGAPAPAAGGQATGLEGVYERLKDKQGTSAKLIKEIQVILGRFSESKK
jgi:hypothetical protein